MKSTLVFTRTVPPSESEGWTLHFVERETRYWVAATAGRKDEALFDKGTAIVWDWASPAQFIRRFRDGESRYGKALWALARVYLAIDDSPAGYPHRKVWRYDLEVAMKIKSSQG
jgi:hypothetical protein